MTARRLPGRMLPRRLLSACAIAAAMAAAALAPGAAHADTLYDQLGADAGLHRIVDNMMVRLLADDRTRQTFDNANIPRLKGLLVEQFCVLTGGPCQYHGVSMKGAHRGLNINDARFNALVEDLQSAMDQVGISSFTQNRFLALLAPMRRDVVTQ